MTHVTCRLTAKNRNQLRNPTLGNRVWATFTFFLQEELANVNMAKYRKLQQEMEGAVERADMAENTLGQLRARNRSASVAPESTTTFGLTV